MNLARVSDSGQITMPMEIRRALKVKAGDKIQFFRKENGEITVQNTSTAAIQDAQKAVMGDIYSEEEILADVMKSRYSAARL